MIGMHFGFIDPNNSTDIILMFMIFTIIIGQLPLEELEWKKLAIA